MCPTLGNWILEFQKLIFRLVGLTSTLNLDLWLFGFGRIDLGICQKLSLQKQFQIFSNMQFRTNQELYYNIKRIPFTCKKSLEILILKVNVIIICTHTLKISVCMCECIY